MSTFAAAHRLHGLSTAAVQAVLAAARALEAGRADEAGGHLAPALGAYPAQPEVLRLHAGILNSRGDCQGALTAMRRALMQRPDDPLYHNTLGSILGTSGEFDAAVSALQRACNLQPNLVVAWFNLGVMLIRCARYDEAAFALRRAVELAPDNVAARVSLADLLRMQGRAPEAIEEYRSAIGEQPWTGMAWWGLADLKTLPLSTNDIVNMQRALQDQRASDDDRIAIGFALAKALDDLGRFADSMLALADANALARPHRPWSARGVSAHVTSILDAFTPPPATASTPTLGREVIFIVGLPRSGSTLAEQILASHSQVEGAGELPDLSLILTEESRRLRVPFPHWVRGTQPADWKRLGERYLDRTSRWQRRAFFTDKLPGNWMHVGAIRAMLPGARVVVCRRDPLETCFSCYRQHLENNEYQRSFDDLAAFWRDFDRSVRHWVALHPGRVHEHVYENLIANPERSIRELLESCGLEFEEACMRFHETQRDVYSPSSAQVRHPLSADTARSARYGALLDPLRSALGLPPFADR